MVMAMDGYTAIGALVLIRVGLSTGSYVWLISMENLGVNRSER